jgi:hypothetical protein
MVTVLAVRHATSTCLPALKTPNSTRRDGSGRTPWPTLSGTSGVSTIFTSQFARTKQTVEPSARELGLLPRLAPPSSTLARDARAGLFGEVVLVAGHSNTIPTLLAVLGATSVPVIGEREFDNLFVLTTHSGDGAPTAPEVRGPGVAKREA